HVAVALLGDPAVVGMLGALVDAGYQAEVGSQLVGGPEAADVTDRGHDRVRDRGVDAGEGHQQLHLGAGERGAIDFCAQRGLLDLQRIEQAQQGVDLAAGDRRQLGGPQPGQPFGGEQLGRAEDEPLVEHAVDPALQADRLPGERGPAAGLPAGTACHPTGTTPTISARRVDRTYDARNRLKTLGFPDGNGDQAWSYYPDGKPQQISTWNIGVEGADPKETRNLYTYFKRGFVKTELIAVPAWYTFSVTHGYNANGHQNKLWYPSGHLVTTTVNALGQPTAISGSGGTYASGITHHPNGAVAGFTYGNGIVHAMVQNARQLPDTVSSVYAGEEFLHDGYAYDE